MIGRRDSFAPAGRRCHRSRLVDVDETGTRLDEAGLATLLAVGVMLLTLVAGAVAVGLGELVAARAATSSAADLAALAGAAAITDGAAPACAAARRTATRNDTTLTACDVIGMDVEVSVQRAAPSIVRAAARVAGRSAPALLVTARAGQAEAIAPRLG